VPFAVQIADTVLGTPARWVFSCLPWHGASGASVQRFEGVFPAKTGAVRRDVSRVVSRPTETQPDHHLSNRNHPRCIASRTDCVPFALPHFSEPPMPEEANGNQARQY